jgi:Secretion system C-terminal sorting domain
LKFQFQEQSFTGTQTIYMQHLILCLIFSLYSATLLFSQPIIQWQKSLGGSGGDRVNRIIQTTAGDYVALGETTSYDYDIFENNGGIDTWVVKLDPAGNIIVSKNYGGAWNDVAQSIAQTSDGGFITAGYSESGENNSKTAEAWILKLDSNLNLEWEKSFGENYEDYAYSILQTADGGYLFGGSSHAFNAPFQAWLVKLDISGNIQWEKKLGGSDSDYAKIIIATNDGGYMVAGETQSHDGDVTGHHGALDIWLIKLDADGNTVWERAYGGSDGDLFPDIVQTQDGGYILSASTRSNDGDIVGLFRGENDYWIVKLDAIGNILWQKVLGGAGIDQPKGITQSSDGSLFIVGMTYSNNGDVHLNHTGSEAWLLKLSDQGNIEWNKTFGGSSNDWGEAITATNDGGCIIGVQSYSTNGDVTGNHGSMDYWIVKFNSNTPTEDPENKLLWNISPNPTTGGLYLKSEENEAISTVTVSNLLGIQLITTSASNIDISELPTGLYTITVQTKDGKIAQKKVVKQ